MKLVLRQRRAQGTALLVLMAAGSCLGLQLRASSMHAWHGRRMLQDGNNGGSGSGEQQQQQQPSQEEDQSYKFSTKPMSLEQWEARCSAPSLQWLRDYIRWHKANRLEPGAKFIVHSCIPGKPRYCSGLGEWAGHDGSAWLCSAKHSMRTTRPHQPLLPGPECR